MGNNKILKYLGMLPRVSLFSNTRINTFVNTVKGKEGFANKNEEREAYCKNKEIIITIRVLVTVVITILAYILFGTSKMAAFAVCAIGAVLIPDLTLIIMLVMIAVQSADTTMASNASNPGAGGADGTHTNKYLSENFFLSETPN